MRVAWKYVPAEIGRQGRDRTPDDFRQISARPPTYGTREELLSDMRRGMHGELLTLLRGLLDPGRRVLSVASGEALYEAVLVAEGYAVVASDLVPEFGAETTRLFPELEVRHIDVLDLPRDECFDDVLAHWIDYALDDDELGQLLEGVRGMLRPGGRLLLAHTYRDTVATRVIDQVLLPLWARPRVTGRRRAEPVLIRKQHGFRRTERELVAAARSHGYDLGRRAAYWHGMELLRLGIDVRAPRLYGIVSRGLKRLDLFPYGVLLELHVGR